MSEDTPELKEAKSNVIKTVATLSKKVPFALYSISNRNYVARIVKMEFKPENKDCFIKIVLQYPINDDNIFWNSPYAVAEQMHKDNNGADAARKYVNGFLELAYEAADKKLHHLFDILCPFIRSGEIALTDKYPFLPVKHSEPLPNLNKIKTRVKNFDEEESKLARGIAEANSDPRIEKMPIERFLQKKASREKNFEKLKGVYKFTAATPRQLKKRKNTEKKQEETPVEETGDVDEDEATPDELDIAAGDTKKGKKPVDKKSKNVDVEEPAKKKQRSTYFSQNVASISDDDEDEEEESKSPVTQAPTKTSKSTLKLPPKVKSPAKTEEPPKSKPIRKQLELVQPAFSPDDPASTTREQPTARKSHSTEEHDNSPSTETAQIPTKQRTLFDLLSSKKPAASSGSHAALATSPAPPSTFSSRMFADSEGISPGEQRIIFLLERLLDKVSDLSDRLDNMTVVQEN